MRGLRADAQGRPLLVVNGGAVAIITLDLAPDLALGNRIAWVKVGARHCVVSATHDARRVVLTISGIPAVGIARDYGTRLDADAAAGLVSVEVGRMNGENLVETLVCRTHNRATGEAPIAGTEVSGNSLEPFSPVTGADIAGPATVAGSDDRRRLTNGQFGGIVDGVDYSDDGAIDETQTLEELVEDQYEAGHIP
jgi:hypothetical protein